MGSVGNPETWPSMNNIRDCSPGTCSIDCPRGCSGADLPRPPPTPTTTFPLQTQDPSDPNFSPLVIAVIGILVAAFLLVTYYTVASKYCASPRGRPAASRPPDRAGDDAGSGGGGGGGGGLEESLIKSMAVCRYRKGEGGVMGTTGCSVCLNEFQQDECLRLLPNCCHAFHVHCIDPWLHTQSNCPLCRVHILPLHPLPPLAPPEVRRSNDHAWVRVEELKQGAPPASSAGDGREQGRREGEVGLKRVERGEGSSMASGGGGEKMSKKSLGRASSTGTTMAIDRPASTSSVDGLSIGNSSRTVINLS